MRFHVPAPAVAWVADDRPEPYPAALEHALLPGADYTLCGRNVALRLEGSPTHPHRGQLTLCPRWPVAMRCRQCARRLATTFTLESGHLYDGTRELSLCGRRLPDDGYSGSNRGEGGWLAGVCLNCTGSLRHVTRWRQLEVPALRVLADALEGVAA